MCTVTAEARRQRGSRTGVIDHCQSLCGWWEWKPPQEQQMLLTNEPSRQNLSEDFLVELVDISVLVWGSFLAKFSTETSRGKE